MKSILTLALITTASPILSMENKPSKNVNKNNKAVTNEQAKSLSDAANAGMMGGSLAHSIVYPVVQNSIPYVLAGAGIGVATHYGYRFLFSKKTEAEETNSKL